MRGVWRVLTGEREGPNTYRTINNGIDDGKRCRDSLEVL